VRLPYCAPHDTGALLRFLAARTIAGVEQDEGGHFVRSLRLPYGTGVVRIAAGAESVQANFTLQDTRDLAAGVAACQHLLDLRSDPQPILEHLGTDPLIGGLVRASPGRRVPGTVDPGELAVRAVLGQQVTLKAAAKLGARLVSAYGETLHQPVGSVNRVFPSVERIAEANLSELPMPNARRQALRALAQSLATEPLEARRDGVEASLRALPGIGPWTSEYIAMRALRDPDAFLATDVGVRRGAELLGFRGTPGELERMAERWRPYRAYAVQHLWALAAGESPQKSLQMAS
jgi:AraC family transcriptional regulator of adaptative response / DNA-3-methyladenine glycosylase II